MVSSTEASETEPDKNLCRDVCAARLRKVIAGHEGDDALPGDFAYLRTRRISWDDVVYELDDAETWTLLQLRQGCPLQPFDPSHAVQVAADPDRPEDATVAYAAAATDDVVDKIQDLAKAGSVIAFSPVPALLRDALGLPAVAIEQVPNVLLSEFPRLIAGL